MAHVRERPSLLESVEITTPAGTKYRWADDEYRGTETPSGERWSDTMPGGYETHDAVLPRKPSLDYDDLERLSTLTRYDAAGEIIWQGRLERAPRVSGDQIAISPSAVGWQAHLEDDKSARVIYRDIDLTHWGPMSNARRIALLATYNGVNDGGVASDFENGLPAVTQSISFSANDKPHTSNLYDAGSGSLIGSIYYNGTETGYVGPNANITALLEVNAQDDLAGAGNNTGDIDAGATGTLTATTARRYAAVSFYWNAAATSGPAEYMYSWRQLAVYGDHGLTLRGTEPDAGFYDGDIIGHAINQWCPFISYTTESLASSSFAIPHLAFSDPTTVGEIVRQATRFGLRDWAVWGSRSGPIFWLHDRGARGRSWRARVAPARLEETGPQVDRLWNSIVVAYQDVDGTTRTVGPVGAGTDTEDDTLTDTDPENPATKLGIIRRDMLTTGTTTAAGATEIGRQFLEQSKLLDSSGRAVFVGHVEDDRGVMHPYSHVNAGDTVTFVDAGDTSSRRIVRTDKNRQDRSCSIDIDAPPEGLQALLERLGVVLVPLGL